MTQSRITNMEQGLTLEQRRAFMKLPVEERRRRMVEQAERMVEHYQLRGEAKHREQWQGGDIADS